MRKLVHIPLNLPEALINAGMSYEYMSNVKNPGGYFDEVYSLSPGGENAEICGIRYMNAAPKDYDEIIKKIKPDVVRVSAGFGPCDWGAANKVENIPLVVSVHGDNPNNINQSIKYADYVICMSQKVKKAVMQYVDIEEGKIYVMPNRVDTTIFCRKEDEKAFIELNNRYGNGKHILHVGRKAEQKNLDTLIKAMQYLPSEYSAVFIGQGDIEPYMQLAHSCQVAERCFFVDRVSNNELPIYYSWCDCMCTPSRWEGFGIVFIEAAACESTIVTSNIGPMNEYLTNGVDAILVDDYENPETLAQQIIKACEKSEDIQNMRTNARKVGLRFSRENVDKQEMALYEKFIRKGADNTVLDRLEEEYAKLQRKVIFFGAGINGKKLMQLCDKGEIECFVDNDVHKWGQQIDGIKIISYEDLLKIYNEYRYNIVVTPKNRVEIVDKLRADGIEYMEGGWFKILKEKENRTGE